MKRLYSNGGTRDFVVGPLESYIRQSSTVRIAAPYFTRIDELKLAANGQRSIQLLIGLNSVTTPSALQQAMALPNLQIRFLTRNFHAKIYLFDNAAMVGSSNLTGGGLMANREATLCIDGVYDSDTLDEVRILFSDLWEDGKSFDKPQLDDFRRIHDSLKKTGPSPDDLIEDAVGIAEPRNINVKSGVRTKEQMFIDSLKKEVVEQYRPYFTRIGEVLTEGGHLRPEFIELGISHQTNRFLNWVRQTFAPGDDWKESEILSPTERDANVTRLGPQWVETTRHMVPDVYFPWLATVQETFGSIVAIERAEKDDITRGLLCLHAFNEQQRFVAGGLKNLSKEFWQLNNNDMNKVKQTLGHLLHGKGDFVVRLHDVLYDRNYKLQLFAKFCALELLGTVKPEISPPMTGRMAKAMRYLGFDVRAN